MCRKKCDRLGGADALQGNRSRVPFLKSTGDTPALQISTWQKGKVDRGIAKRVMLSERNISRFSDRPARDPSLSLGMTGLL
jgi:hypothetical protein